MVTRCVGSSAGRTGVSAKDVRSLERSSRGDCQYGTARGCGSRQWELMSCESSIFPAVVKHTTPRPTISNTRGRRNAKRASSLAFKWCGDQETRTCQRLGARGVTPTCRSKPRQAPSSSLPCIANCSPWGPDIRYRRTPSTDPSPRLESRHPGGIAPAVDAVVPFPSRSRPDCAGASRIITEATADCPLRSTWTRTRCRPALAAGYSSVDGPARADGSMAAPQPRPSLGNGVGRLAAPRQSGPLRRGTLL